MTSLKLSNIDVGHDGTNTMEEKHGLRLRSELATQQKRIRHLRTVVARNLAINDDMRQMNTFFTLSDIRSKKAIYTSEAIKLTPSPSWKSFNLAHRDGDDLSSMMTSFVIKVWLDYSGKRTLLMDWTVDLTGLVFISDKVQYDGCTYPMNTLLFAMHDGFYGASSVQATEEKYRSIDVHQCTTRVDTSLIRHSYTTGSLLRIQTVVRAIKQTQAVVSKVRDSIEEHLCHSLHQAKKHSRREVLLLKVNQLRRDLEWRTMQLQSEKESFEIQQTSFNTRNTEVNTKFETLQNDKERLQEKRKSYFEIREDLIKTSAQLVMRRKQLISELAFIYPICELVSDYSISGVKLPNSEAFSGQDEVMIAVALGYTSHLIQMISHFLDVPVRYPMEHRCSRSRIRDHIHDKLTDKERDFPLYSKGKEKFQFNYGVYLMNKNIAQLRYYCGLGTTDLRITLPNLKSLLELRLGVKFDAGSACLILSDGQPSFKEAENPDSSLLHAGLILPTNHNHQIIDSADSSEFEILLEQNVKDEPLLQTGEDLFIPGQDTFFQPKASASSNSLSDAVSDMFNQEHDSNTVIEQKDAIVEHMDTDGDMCTRQDNTRPEHLSAQDTFDTDTNSDYHLSLSDPTFIVNNTYESSHNEPSCVQRGTFKTGAMLTQAPTDDATQRMEDGNTENVSIEEISIQDRTGLLTTNISSFKLGMVLQQSDSCEE